MLIRSEIFSAETTEIRKRGNSGLEISAIGLDTKIHPLKENLNAEKITLTAENLCSATPSTCRTLWDVDT